MKNKITLFPMNNNYRLWKYAVIVSDTEGNGYVKDGDHRCNTQEEAVDYAASQTTGKIRGVMREDDFMGVWDMTEDAIRRDPAFDPTLPDEKYKKGYDNVIRPFMPLKRKRCRNFRGKQSLELHPIPKEDQKDPKWRSLLAYKWNATHEEILAGGAAPSLATYTARSYLIESIKKVESGNKFLLAAATGAGKETSTLALLVHLHDVKNYNNKILNVAVATIPSTISELMNELATVAGMEVDGRGFVDFSRIKIYVTKQWHKSYCKDCTNAAKAMIGTNRVTVVESVSDIPKSHKSGEVPVLFGSYHDVAQKSDDKLYPRYAGLAKRIGTLSIGEAHQMLSTADNKMWTRLNSTFGKKCFKLFVTGTPYDFIYGNVAAEFFDVNERALFTRNDVYRDKRLKPKSDFKDYPDYNYYGIDVEEVVNKLKKEDGWKDDAEGFTWSKLFSYDPKTTKKFVYEKTILWFFRRSVGSSAFDENGDPLSIYNATELCEAAKQHVLVALPAGNKNASAKVYIPALKKLLTDNNVLNGTIFDAYEDGLGDRKDDINNAKGRTLTLTCVKDCTGANIPKLGCFVFMRKIGDSVKFFEQSTGRIGRKSPGKTNCGVFIGDLEGAMNLMIEIEEKISVEHCSGFGTREIIEDTISNYNFFFARNGSWQKMDVGDFSDILEKLNARGNYGINQCVKFSTAPKGFNLSFKNSVSKVSEKLELTSNGNKGAKNNKNKIVAQQIGFTFDKKKTPDENWNNMKLSFIAKCRLLSFIYDLKTVDECVDLVKNAIENNNESVLTIVGKGAEWFTQSMNKEHIDVSYTNRWIHKFNDNKKDTSFVLNEFSDKIYRTEHSFVPEQIEFLKQIVEKLFDNGNITEDSYIIDPAAGRGSFLILILEVAKERGIKIDPSKLFYNDIDPSMVAFFKKINKNSCLQIPNCNIYCGDFLAGDYIIKKYRNMKFDVVVTNFPYQATTNGKTRPVWHVFLKKAFSILKEGGYLTNPHPAGWRNVEGLFSDTRDLLLSKNMQYLEIHNEKDGMSTFGAKTRYDWYVLENTEYSGKTQVVFEDGTEKIINLNKLPFIPNHSLDLIKKLLAKPEEETVEIVSDCAYHTQRTHVNDTKTTEFKYPVVQSVKMDGSKVLRWSSINDKGHFGIPKFVFCRVRIGSSETFVDIDGEYGMTEFCYAIVDEVENLTNIKKAYDSKEFQNLMWAMATIGFPPFRHFKLFRKDFWKEFV